MPGDIVIYFAPHFPSFTEPIVSPRFRAFLEACNVCVLEWGDRWTTYEPELESLFNRLSRGELRWVVSRRLGRTLNPFDAQLQNAIRGTNREITLERPPVEYVFIEEGDVTSLAREGRLGEAVSLYRSQLRLLIWNLNDRDRALVQLLKKLRTTTNLFVFRGADHERFLRHALSEENIGATWYVYEEPPLLRRLIGSLSMGEQVSDADLQRVIFAMTQRRTGDYPEFVRLQREAETMSQLDVLSRFSS
jgi:hypothetical protein